MTEELSRSDHKRLLGILRNWIRNELIQQHAVEPSKQFTLTDYVREEMRAAVRSQFVFGSMHHEVECIIRNEVSAVLTSWRGQGGKIGDRGSDGLKNFIGDLVKAEVKAQITELVRESMDFEVNVSGKVRRPASRRVLDLMEEPDGEGEV